jgi:uncharacterized protein YxeA
MKKIMAAAFAVLFIAACSKAAVKEITKDQFVEVMSEMGCKQLTEGSPAAVKYYETKGVTQKDIENFRKNSDPQEMVEVSQTIAQKVAECYTAAVGTTEGQ